MGVVVEMAGVDKGKTVLWAVGVIICITTNNSLCVLFLLFFDSLDIFLFLNKRLTLSLNQIRQLIKHLHSKIAHGSIRRLSGA